MPTREHYVKEINKQLSEVRNASLSLFNLFRTANEELPASEYRKLRKEVNCDLSSVCKIEKIFECDLIMDNIEKMPVAWSTLYELQSIEASILRTLIDKKSINRKMTKQEAKELKRLYASDISAQQESEEAIVSNDPQIEIATTVITLRLYAKASVSDEEMKHDLDKVSELLSDHFEVEADYDD